MSAAVHGSCHCGAVRITLPYRPDYVNECNCTLCTKSGFRGVYFASGEVEVTGPVVGYVRSDIATPMITNFRCERCGSPTHWEPMTPPPHARIGINGRLLDDGGLDGVEVRRVDGRSWD